MRKQFKYLRHLNIQKCNIYIHFYISSKFSYVNSTFSILTNIRETFSPIRAKENWNKQLMVPNMQTSEYAVNLTWWLTSDNQVDNGGKMHVTLLETFWGQSCQNDVKIGSCVGWFPAPTPPSCRGRYGPPLKSVCLQNATRSAWKAVAVSLSDKRRQVWSVPTYVSIIVYRNIILVIFLFYSISFIELSFVNKWNFFKNKHYSFRKIIPLSPTTFKDSSPNYHSTTNCTLHSILV